MGRSVRLCGLLMILVATPRAHVAAQESTPRAAEMLVVMSDGRILRGNVLRHATGYYVERPGGSILVPKDQIRCVARDLRDAYRLQREQMIDPTSGMLIQLAEWCISYRLYDEAGDELRRALRRDPENDTARQMLARLEEMLSAEPTKAFRPARIDLYGAIAPDVESLGGLSREAAAEFTAKVQPLLINKCGSAGCHGGAGTDSFRLTHVRNGSANHRRASEQNLAAVLRLINIDDAARSRMLEATQGSHGGAAFAIFGGASGAIQRQLLESWVQTVAAEHQAETAKLAGRTPLKNKSPTTAAAETVRMASLEVEAAAPLMGESAAALESPADEVSGGERPPRHLSRQDPFDPDVFNQQSPRMLAPERR